VAIVMNVSFEPIEQFEWLKIRLLEVPAFTIFLYLCKITVHGPQNKQARHFQEIRMPNVYLSAVFIPQTLRHILR
jgi:hypothetical protein